jgi:drug/metabolite transporter (DMT)-like permease
VVGPLGLGILLIVVGLALFFVPGIGILGIVLLVVGVLMIAGGFASGRRRSAAPPP